MTTEDRLRNIIDTKIEIKQIAIGRFTINYAVAGSGPNLLLIHGANFGWGVWYPNITKLAKNFTVYAIDLPGAGRSTRIDYKTMVAKRDLLQVVESFVDNLQLTNLNIIGCSIGGWIALELSLKHPEKINKIILENFVGLADYVAPSDRIIGFYPFAKLISQIFINPRNRISVEKFLRGIFYNKNLPLTKEFLDYFYETMQTSHNLLFISRLTALHKELNLEEELSSIKSKILVIWGEKDKIIPLEKSIDNIKLIPNVELSIIKDAGHIPSLEKPEEFNDLAQHFLLKP